MVIALICPLIIVETLAVSDCVRHVSESARNTVCDVRQYRVTKGVEADRYVQCFMTALGFADESGSIQVCVCRKYIKKDNTLHTTFFMFASRDRTF